MTQQQNPSTSRDAEDGAGMFAQSVQRPNVEVFETAEGITLRADLPGVSSDRLTVQVDKDTLLIEARTELQLPDTLKALHAEMRSRRYRRAFSLSGELDAEGIKATLRDGVLDLHIPKRAAVRPRRIAVGAH